MNERLLELEGQGVTGQGPMEGVKSMGGDQSMGIKARKELERGQRGTSKYSMELLLLLGLEIWCQNAINHYCLRLLSFR